MFSNHNGIKVETIQKKILEIQRYMEIKQHTSKTSQSKKKQQEKLENASR